MKILRAVAKRIWSKQELTITYYSAKYNMSGIHLDEGELVHGVIGNTTKNSLKKQVANFRFLLNIDGYQLKHASQAMKDLVEEYNNLSQAEVKKLVMSYIDASDAKLKKYTTQVINKEAFSSRDRLNKILENNHINKIASMMKYRNLVRLA